MRNFNFHRVLCSLGLFKLGKKSSADGMVAKESAISNQPIHFNEPAVRSFRYLMTLIGLLFLLVVSGAPVYAGGGGENLLFIVNPNDESALRIANTYIAARKIPVNNILYIAPPTIAGYPVQQMYEPDFTSLYRTPILNAVATRGLTNQIDYIATIGQPTLVVATYPGTATICLHDALNHLTQLQNGMTVNQICYRTMSELVQDPELLSSITFNYTAGSNTAIHHSQKLTPLGASGTASYVQWYMAGTLNQAGQFGLTPTQVIQNILRTVPGDGKKPAGSIYFEDGTDIRVTTRKLYWPPIQSYMTAHGIPWVQEDNSAFHDNVPINVKNCRGGEIGLADINYSLSMYVPGAWTDNLTSNGGLYVQEGQTTACEALLAGNGGSSGTVLEPTADVNRFPTAAVWIYQNDGSTLGESLYKSVNNPDLLMFQGDLLSQAYADVPNVAFTSAPADGSTVSGTVSLTAAASLSAAQTATGIGHLELFVDGLDTGAAVTGSTGAFNFNTTAVLDGVHEVRVVAYNNSLAASEGYVLENLVVNNQGQSVSIGSSNCVLSSTQVLSLPVSAVQGSGTSISSIQLQSYGRVLGSVVGSSGNIGLNASLLAFGKNIITPVAILASGKQVVGAPISALRQFQQMPGSPVTPVSNQNPGFDYYYYGGAAGKTLATTNFTGTATYVQHSNICQIYPSSGNPALWNLPAPYRTTAGGSTQGLAMMIKSNFNVTQPGEYSFFGTIGSGNLACNVSSYAIEIDGVTLTSYDLWNGTSFAALNQASTGTALGTDLEQLRTVYLLPGEHRVVIKLVQYNGGVTDAQFTYLLNFRGLQTQTNIEAGSSARAVGPFFYTIKNKLVP